MNSGVIILPLHNPVRLAKAIATLDVLSGGRVMVTFGAGMAPGEFSALGVDFSRRGRMMDEYIQAMKVLWTADQPEFHGEFVDFADVVFEPKPAQRPHPPLFVGGRSVFALRRAARLADRWAPSGAQAAAAPGCQARRTCRGSWPRRVAATASRSGRARSKSRCTPSPS